MLDAVRTPLDLGRQAAPDPFALEPGAIVFERFCVIGRVEHSGSAWSVPVTDIRREMGSDPHHRLLLYFLPGSLEEESRVRAAVQADAAIQPRVYALVSVTGGVVLIATPVEHARPLSQEAEAVSVAVLRGLASLLLRLHKSGVYGVRFQPEELSAYDGEVALHGFAHLLGHGDAASDVATLVELMRGLGDDEVTAALATLPLDAAELSHRLRLLEGVDHVDWATVLPGNPPFVGRQSVLRDLVSKVARASVAKASLVVLRGGRGMGKSRLLRQLALDLGRTGDTMVLEGRWAQGTGLVRNGLAAALDTLRDKSAAFPSPEQDALRRRVVERTAPLGRVVSRLAPSLHDWFHRADEPPEIELSEHFVRHASVVSSALAAVGTPRTPLVLLLDNLEDADQGSLAVLRSLLDERTHHTLVVAAVRGEVPADLENVAECIDLGDLDVVEVEDLLAQAVPGPIHARRRVATRLHHASQGVPLGAWALLQTWLDEGQLARGSGDGPWTLDERVIRPTPIVDLYRVRFAQADEDEHRLALLAAVRGGPAPVQWLSHLCGWEEARFGDSVDRLIRRGLLYRDAGGILHFVHDSVREIVVEGTGTAALRQAHALVAEWLLGQGEVISAAQRAYHGEQAEAPGRDEALAKLHLAGGEEMLRIFDLDRAGWHFAAALSRCEATDTHVRALQGSADVAILSGDASRAVAEYIEAVNTADDPADRVNIAVRAVYTLLSKAGAEDARAVAARALALVGDPLPSTKRSEAWATVVALFDLVTGRNRRRHSVVAREALCQLYTRLNAVLVALAPGQMGVCILRAANIARGLESAGAGSALAFWGCLWAALGRYDRARRIFRTAEGIAERAGVIWNLAIVRHLYAHWVELPSGRYESGQQLLDSAIEGFRRTGDLSVATLAYAFKALYGRDRETAAVLVDWLDQAEACARRHGNQFAYYPAASLRLVVAARQNKAGVTEAAVRLSEQIDTASMHSGDELTARAALAMALLRAGSPRDALIEVEKARAKVSSGPAPETCLDIFWVGANVALAQPSPGREHGRLLRWMLRRLKRVGAISNRFGVTRQLVLARLAVRRGRLPLARRLLADLIARADRHGELHPVLEAHCLLAEVLAGADVLAAAEHHRFARQLAERLGVSLPGERTEHAPARVPATPSTAPSLLPAGPAPAPDGVALRPLVHRVVDDLESTLSGSIEVGADEEVVAYGTREELGSLLTHLVLTGRDSRARADHVGVRIRSVALDQESAARLPGGKAGSYAQIDVWVRGPSESDQSVIGGLGACRQSVALLGGFLDVSQEDLGCRISAYVPAAAAPQATPSEPASQRSALVVHSHPFVRRTVVAALAKLGWTAVDGVPGESPSRPRAWDAVFVEDGVCLDVESPAGSLRVTLLQRSARPASGVVALRVPFTVDELKSLLDSVAAAPSGRAHPPG